jgi:Glycosyltransferase family 87
MSSAPANLRRRYCAQVAVWGLMAAINLSAGALVATRPERDTDVLTVRRWVSEWLHDGTDIYSTDPSDYPPNAIVGYAPLLLIPERRSSAIWGGFNLALAILATYLALRSVRKDITLSDAWLPMFMFLCWGGFRTLLQFTLLATTCGLASIVLSEARPAWAGASLALSLAKPQVGAPFLLWALFTRRWRMVAVSAAVLAVEFAAFCARARANPWHIVGEYAATLRLGYLGEGSIAGLSQLRPPIRAWSSNVGTADAIAATAAVCLLGVVCALAVREVRDGGDGMYSLPALAGVWSLLTFYHLTYGFVLLLPAAALLLMDRDSETRVFRTRFFWVIQAGLMADLPGLWRRVGPLLDAPAWIVSLMLHADRALMAGTFICLAVLAARRQTTRAPTRLTVPT